MQLLLALANKPDSAIEFGDLSKVIRCGDEELQQHISALRDILGDPAHMPGLSRSMTRQLR
jgi:hypothetical protein